MSTWFPCVRGYPGRIGRIAQFSSRGADQKLVKLFGRNDEAYADAKRNGQQALRTLPQSRLNEQCAKLREVHHELDAIEAQISALRERQAASLLRASKPKVRPGQVQTLDLRTLDDVDLTNARLDTAALEMTTPEETNRVDADFDRRFAAFASAESDDSSRRWLDTA